MITVGDGVLLCLHNCGGRGSLFYPVMVYLIGVQDLVGFRFVNAIQYRRHGDPKIVCAQYQGQDVNLDLQTGCKLRNEVAERMRGRRI